MKVCGLSRSTRLVPMRPSAIRPRNFFDQGVKLCTSAMMSAAMKPTLCRWSAYCAPGLPRPTHNCIAQILPLWMGRGTMRSMVEGCWSARPTPPPSNLRSMVPLPTSFARREELLAALAFALGLAAFTFLALDGRDCVGRGGLFLFGLHRRRGDDGRDGEILVGVGDGDALRQLHLTDVDRITDFKPVERIVDLAWNARRVANQLELVLDDVENAAALEAGRGVFIVEADR